MGDLAATVLLEDEQVLITGETQDPDGEAAAGDRDDKAAARRKLLGMAAADRIRTVDGLRRRTTGPPSAGRR